MPANLIRLKATGIWLSENLDHYVQEVRNDKQELVGLDLNFGVHKVRVTDLNDIAIFADAFGLSNEDVNMATPVSSEPAKSAIEQLLDDKTGKPTKAAKK